MILTTELLLKKALLIEKAVHLRGATHLNLYQYPVLLVLVKFDQNHEIGRLQGVLWKNTSTNKIIKSSKFLQIKIIPKILKFYFPSNFWELVVDKLGKFLKFVFCVCEYCGIKKLKD